MTPPGGQSCHYSMKLQSAADAPSRFCFALNLFLLFSSSSSSSTHLLLCDFLCVFSCCQTLIQMRESKVRSFPWQHSLQNRFCFQTSQFSFPLTFLKYPLFKSNFSLCLLNLLSPDNHTSRDSRAPAFCSPFTSAYPGHSSNG